MSFLSQQYEQITAALKGLRDHAEDLRRTTGDEDLKSLAEGVLADTKTQMKGVKESAEAEFAE